ncbi:MAG: aminoacyl-tRNA hydrolase [Opitutaceae bacterium]|nr:aminoacyl-tRNA hydrolase [Cytophagales bacterium]
MNSRFAFYTIPANWQQTDIIKEVTFKATLSGGSGGQNVNKVSSKMELYWSPGNCVVLDQEKKDKILLKLAPKLSGTGEIRLVCDEERSQLQNKEKLITKFYRLLASCFEEQKARRASKPTKSSVANRLEGKKFKKEIKKGRGKIDF